jgi:hypothetical protein
MKDGLMSKHLQQLVDLLKNSICRPSGVLRGMRSMGCRETGYEQCRWNWCSGSTSPPVNKIARLVKASAADGKDPGELRPNACPEDRQQVISSWRLLRGPCENLLAFGHREQEDAFACG